MISVLMPVYNHAAYLRESIDSILQQSESDFELIIINDGSTEPVADIVQQYSDERIRFRSNSKQIGLPRTINIALRLSRGSILCRQDSDDVSHTDRLGLLKEMVDAGHPVVTSRYGRIDAAGNEIGDSWMEEANRVSSISEHSLRIQNVIVGPAPMWTREVLQAVGNFNERMTVASDYNYWLRVLKQFPIEIVDHVLYFHRRHPGSHRLNNYRDENGNKVDFAQLARELT